MTVFINLLAELQVKKRAVDLQCYLMLCAYSKAY